MATRIVDKNGNELLVASDGSLTTTPSSTAQPISIAAPSSVSNTVLATSLVIKNAAGTLFTLNAYNDKATAQYIQIHNASSLPAEAAVPVFVFSLATKAVTTISFDLRGKPFSTGIVVCNSSTANTKTIGSADCWFDAEYV